MQGAEGRALRADEPLRERVVLVAADARDVAVLDLEPQPAGRLAEGARPERHPRHSQTIQPRRPVRRKSALRRHARGAPRGRSATRRRRRCTRRSRGSAPSRTSMCLRWMPSNAAGSAARAGAGALVEGVRLELDAAAAEGVEGVLQLEELGLGVGARAPGCRGEPRPADLEAPVLGAQRQEARRADRLPVATSTVANARSSPASTRASASSIQACHSSRVCGWTIGSQRQTRGSRDASQRSSACRCASGSSRTIRPSSVGVGQRSTTPGQYTRGMPIYEYACMECEDHFDELVRSDDQVITCPSCNATDVLKQISAFAVHGAAAKPSFGGSGGGCCGGVAAAAAKRPRRADVVRPSASPPRLAGRWMPSPAPRRSPPTPPRPPAADAVASPRRGARSSSAPAIPTPS